MSVEFVCLILIVSLGISEIYKLKLRMGQPLNYKELRRGRHYTIMAQCLSEEKDHPNGSALVALKPRHPYHGPVRIYRFYNTFREGVTTVRVSKTREGEIEVEPANR